MCGIYGEVRLRDLAEVGAHADHALDLLVHRGPDERGTWRGAGVFLGSRRLSIIDLAGGKQPITNEDGSLLIIYNGELYNFRDLRPELEALGHRFRTNSDTEVVLHAYEEWGPECLRRLNGMFAFAIWNDRDRTLFLARDRIGEKPLYYRLEGDRIAFASEIKALLADLSATRRMNFRGLSNFLAFGHAVAPETMYEGILKLPPGHYLLASRNGVAVRAWWDVGDEPQVAEGETLGEDDYAARVRELLDDSVRRRLVADVPVGAFLSGGVDSSAVVALMAKHVPGRVQTFSLGFTAGGGYDERSDARLVAERLGTEHHELLAEHVDLVDTLQTLVYHYDEPFADPAGFPLYLLSRFARERVTVALTGDGGDELFGGYRRYAIEQLAPAYQRLPGTLTRRVVPALVDRLPRTRRLKQLARNLPVADPARRYAGWLTVFSPEMRTELLSRDVTERLGDHDPASSYGPLYSRLDGGTDHLNRLMYVDLKSWLADGYMEKTDKATMACSLEGRLPFLDHRLVELAFQIPGRHKVRGWSTKRILKRAVRDLVPPEVLAKRKHGFSVPTDPWFRGELRSFALQVLLDEGTRRRGYFDSRVVERLWREHGEGRRVWDSHLWLLLNFELWHRAYLDDGVVPAGRPS